MNHNAMVDAGGWLTDKAWTDAQESVVLWVAGWTVLIEGHKLLLVFHPVGKNIGIPSISFWKNGFRGLSEERSNDTLPNFTWRSRSLEELHNCLQAAGFLK